MWLFRWDGILCPGAATWWTGLNTRVVFNSDPFAPSCESMTSSTKPEVHNVLYYRQKNVEPRPQVTCTKNLVKFGHVVFETCERIDSHTDRQTRQTNKHTYRYADHNTLHPYRGELMIKQKTNYEKYRTRGYKQRCKTGGISTHHKLWIWVLSYESLHNVLPVSPKSTQE